MRTSWDTRYMIVMIGGWFRRMGYRAALETHHHTESHESHHLRASVSDGGGSKYRQRARNAVHDQSVPHSVVSQGRARVRTVKCAFPHDILNKQFVANLVALVSIYASEEWCSGSGTSCPPSPPQHRGRHELYVVLRHHLRRPVTNVAFLPRIHPGRLRRS